MGKTLGSWSGMRKYLEQEMLAPTLQGRLRYGCTAYVGMDGCHIFEVFIDRTHVKRFSWETVNTYFINNGYTTNSSPNGIGEYWADFWYLMDKYPLDKRTEMRYRSRYCLWRRWRGLRKNFLRLLSKAYLRGTQAHRGVC